MIAGFTLADGQLPSTAGAIEAGANGTVNVSFANVGGQSETVVLTVKRGSAGTARQIARFVLSANEGAVVAGLALDGRRPISRPSPPTSCEVVNGRDHRPRR